MPYTNKQRLIAWCVHCFTASGGVLGLFTLYLITNQHYVASFWFMGATIVIDGTDGFMARKFKVKEIVPSVDGALLDNIVDYINYALVPAYFVLMAPVIPHGCRAIAAILVVLAALYQFTQTDAKTSDHYFKGFPSYWNLVVIYMLTWNVNHVVNFVILVFLAILSFIPIKYIYPTRLDCFSKYPILKYIFIMTTLVWIGCTIASNAIMPERNHVLIGIVIAYIAFYTLLSLYMTFIERP